MDRRRILKERRTKCMNEYFGGKEVKNKGKISEGKQEKERERNIEKEERRNVR